MDNKIVRFGKDAGITGWGYTVLAFSLPDCRPPLGATGLSPPTPQREKLEVAPTESLSVRQHVGSAGLWLAAFDSKNGGFLIGIGYLSVGRVLGKRFQLL